jgi:phosphomannomutase
LGEGKLAAPFKAYDVRGVYGKFVTEDLAYKIGRAFVIYLNAKKVLVGQDMRKSSKSLFESLTKGMMDEGADVTSIGLSSTDMFYFASINKGFDGGIQITASHNSKEYNGFKFVKENATPIGIDSGLKQIEDIVREGKFKEKKAKGKLNKINVLNDFSSFIKSIVDPKSLNPFRIVIDAGNGMGGLVMPELLKSSPVEVFPMYYELDGSFPNHDANPLLEENRTELSNKVKELGADFGVGLDGDADRAFFVDEDGNFCDGDFILGLLAKEVLKEHPNSTITYDVRCSNFVKDSVEKMGGRALMCKVGHAYAKLFMKKVDASFGGEVSGHYYFKYKDSFFDSGPLTVLMLLKVLSNLNKSLKEAMKETKNYFVSGEINLKVNDADKIMNKILDTYKNKVKVIKIDGISLVDESWWVNIRKSNTEPLLRLNCEAKSKKEMEELRDKFLSIINKG